MIERQRCISASVDPSRIRQGMTIPFVFAPVISGSRDLRNFEIRERGVLGEELSEHEIAITPGLVGVRSSQSRNVKTDAPR